MENTEGPKIIFYSKSRALRRQSYQQQATQALTVVIIGRAKQPTVHVQKNIFEKTLIEVGSPYLCASFGTFRAQIGQSFEAQ